MHILIRTLGIALSLYAISLSCADKKRQRRRRHVSPESSTIIGRVTAEREAAYTQITAILAQVQHLKLENEVITRERDNARKQRDIAIERCRTLQEQVRVLRLDLTSRAAAIASYQKIWKEHIEQSKPKDENTKLSPHKPRKRGGGHT